MKYVIMCGGTYKDFSQPKALTEVNGEKLIDRTIRLLIKESVSLDDIKISSNNEKMNEYGVTHLVEVLHHENVYVEGETENGYWLDAFYPMDEPVCYLFGDVYYTTRGIHEIVTLRDSGNVLFATRNDDLKKWDEPLAYKVYDTEEFRNGIYDVKMMHRMGLCRRHPIVWELYRYLNNLDINVHAVKPATFVEVMDGGMDIDKPEEAKKVGDYYRKRGPDG